MSNQVPSVGRIVHFVTENGRHRPGVISSCGAAPDFNYRVARICIHVNFLPGDMARTVEGVFEPVIPVAIVWAVYDEETKAPGTWHLPEYVAPVT